MSIAAIGAVFVDVKGYPFSTYIPAGRNAGKVEQVDGGVCRNVVEDIANIGLNPTFLSLVDENGMGEDALKRLVQHDVNTQYIKRIKDGMGTWLAVFNEGGDVVASISKRPDLLPILDTMEKYGDEVFSKCDSIIIEFDIEQEIVEKAFYYAKKYNKEIFCVVANMSLAQSKRDLIQKSSCFVCNQQEAGILFAYDYDSLTPAEVEERLVHDVKAAGIPKMVATLGAQGAVYADIDGNHGFVPAIPCDVKDTTGAGDAFFAGVAAGLTYGKDLAKACEIGTRLAASVITSFEAVCPKFEPEEFDISI